MTDTTAGELELAKAERAAIAADMSRDMRACPIRYFTTERRPSQTPFFHDTHPIQGIESGRRAGKTECPVGRGVSALTGIEPLSPELRGMSRILPKPPVCIRHWCVDIVRAVDTVLLPKYRRWLPKSMLDSRNGTGGFNHERKQLRLKNGSMVQFMAYTMDPQAGEMFEAEIVAFDEVPPEYRYESQKVRILTARDKHFYMWICGTRAEEAMTWPVQWFDTRIIRGGDGPAVSHHTFNTQENLDATAEERAGEDAEEYKARQQAIIGTMSADARDVLIGGQADWSPGVVYKQFGEHNEYTVADMTPAVFRALAEQGFGRIWAGMDYGQSGGMTCVAYVYVAHKPIEALLIAAGDYIQIGEFCRGNRVIVDNLGPLQERQRFYRPAAYWCDPHMWNREGAGPSAAVLYSQPEILRDITRATNPGFQMGDLTPIRPMWKGRNHPGSVDEGIQIVSAMLMPRSGGTFWPRYRLLPRENPYTKRGFQEWQRKKAAQLRVGEDRFNHQMKDPMDAVRYLVAARPDLLQEGPPPQMNDPASLYGLPLSAFTQLAGVYE